MSLFVRACPWALLAATAGGLSLVGSTRQDLPAPTKVSEPAIPVVAKQYGVPRAEYVGATSCAAAACHSGDQPHLNQYQVWAGQNADSSGPRDPHAKAYRVLFNEVSQRIARNLNKTYGTDMPAHENSLCLKCHGQAKFETAAYPPEPIRRDAIADMSVGCESCHGPAEHYLTTHYLPGFKQLPDSEKATRYGLYPTKDLAFRAQLCAACHMGDSSREVNHDLIAAGHPRLMFEYTAFHNNKNYDKHWRADPHEDFEVRAWVLGQAANIRSAVDVLKMRAEQAAAKNLKQPWPEFAEYSCYACHQNLLPDRKSWKEVTEWEHALGYAPWGTWTLPTLGALEKMSETLSPGAKPPLDDLKTLRDAMESPGSTPAAIVEQCKATLAGIDQWMARLKETNRTLTDADRKALRDALLTNALTETGERFKNLDWDGVMQHYLGLRAAGVAPDQAATMNELGEELKFPKNFDNPVKTDPKKALELFKRLNAPNPERKPKS